MAPSGGYDTLRTVLLFDAVVGTWSLGPSLLSGTGNVSVLAVGDQVHVVGGQVRTAHQIYDAVAGSWSSGPPSQRIRFACAAAVLNDPVADRWSASPRSLAAVTLGGRVYALGGESTPGGVRASVTPSS